MTAPADRFVDLACLTYGDNESRARRDEAAQLLATTPELVTHSVHAAAAAGDLDALRAHLARDPRCHENRDPLRGWVPLLALCYSRVAQRDALGCLEQLLASGAEPNAFVMLGDCRFTALTGVIGQGEAGPIEQPSHPHARALAGRLLDAGADPNDAQALYNTHFLPNNEWLELLLARGLSSRADLDYLLGQSAVQGFTERVRRLLAHGANPDGTNHYNRRTHLANALLEGHADIVRALTDAGATMPALSEVEQFRIAVLANDEVRAREILATAPAAREQPAVLHSAAQQGRVDAIELALALGVPIDGIDHGGLTALHHAARGGHLAAVRALVARGASLTIRDRMYDGTPLGHARHFASHWPRPQAAEIVAFLESCAT